MPEDAPWHGHYDCSLPPSVLCADAVRVLYQAAHYVIAPLKCEQNSVSLSSKTLANLKVRCIAFANIAPMQAMPVRNLQASITISYTFS